MTLAAYAVVFGVLGLLGYVRFSPVDTAVWHVDPLGIAVPGAAWTALPTDCAITPYARGARAVCMQPGTPAEALARLDAVAMASPRTYRFSGSVAQGLITWETRSLVFGFPDYTTASVQLVDGKARLAILARLRFGESDFGVNARRLAQWLARLK